MISANNSLAVVILAAGQGTRMKSTLPKVLHEICGRSLIGHVLSCAKELNPAHTVAVVRHEKEKVAGHILEFAPETIIAEQDEIPGTGRAVEKALAALPTDFNGDVVVLSGDVPLIDAATINSLLAEHRSAASKMTVLTTVLQNPTGLGRVVRDSAGLVARIVEEKDASAAERKITEVNGGVYVFEKQALSTALQSIDTNNAQGEKYLTDAASKILAAGGTVAASLTTDSWVIAGVNDKVQLAEAGTELNRRVIAGHQRAGVTVVAPAATYIDVTVKIAPDAVIEPGTLLRGKSEIASGAVVGPDTTLVDTVVGEGATVKRSEVHKTVVGEGAQVGPFSYIRPETELAAESKIGAFVEVKKSQIGAGSKVPHLSYVGDATIGKDANLGAGTIVANYDGVNKHKTTVQDAARVGSKTVLVAPVTVGAGAYTGAGTVVRKDVPAGALALTVAAQRNIADWVAENRAGTTSAKAAEATNGEQQ